MPNKVVSRTQVPVVPADIYFEATTLLDENGNYVKHQVRVLYQVYDDQGKVIQPKRDYPGINLTAPQEAALASFVDNLVAKANQVEGT